MNPFSFSKFHSTSRLGNKRNMDDKTDIEKIDDVMLPGFRFHPTDEELVGFYLKGKIQQKSLPIEFIKQVDIYKYDPWDLPKLASTGEKEWYFYCPRDRKYRNSARPNRATGAGFWKATGTDRPIYSSDGTKCIGLKKSLVFYTGRAAKGIKTDWMMHEFRLPSLADSAPPKKPLDKNIPPNDAWAICRVFKKASTVAQRALSHSWVSTLPETSASDVLNQGAHCTDFSPENISCTTEIDSVIQLSGNTDLQQALNPSFYKPSLFPDNFMFSPGPTDCTVDASSLLLNPSLLSDFSQGSDNIEFEESQQQVKGFSISMPQEIQGNMIPGENEPGSRRNINATHDNSQWGSIRSIGFGFPFSLPFDLPEAWKLNWPWDSPPGSIEMSTTCSKNNCYN